MKRSPPEDNHSLKTTNLLTKKLTTMKTTFFKISAFVLLFVLVGAGCEDNADSKVNQLNQLDFKIVTLDKNQVEKSDFKVGDDVVLAFKAINNSGKTLELRLKTNYLTCKIFQSEKDFFLVKKKTPNYDGDSSFISIGKPNLEPINCLAINLPYYAQIFQNGETILESAFWSNNPNNEMLEPGKYFSMFALTLDVEDYSKSWILRTDFEVKQY